MNKVLPFFIFIILSCFSCQHEIPNYTIPYQDFIITGQRAGSGIYFENPDPKIEFYVADPWSQTQMSTPIDLDHDGTNDFLFHGSVCDPTMLGADCEDFWIRPLNENEVCTTIDNNWLDTLSLQDTVNTLLNWSKNESLIYSYYWDMTGTTSTAGCWYNSLESTTPHFIGVKIMHNEIPYFGWIKMHRDLSMGLSFHYIIDEWAIIRDFKME